MRVSHGLKWENKMYKIKRSIDGSQHRSQTLSRKSQGKDPGRQPLNGTISIVLLFKIVILSICC